MDSNRLRKHLAFRSRFLPTARDFVVYLPEPYMRDPQARFPVLYLQDGQNLFDPATSFVPGMDWKVGDTADALISAGKIRPLVIVGIYNTGKKRVREYTPSRDRKRVGGGADKYGRMLLEELRPLVELEYRVLTGAANTGIGGSSLGGLLSIYLGLRYTEAFGRVAVLSPSVWWNQRWILGFVSRVQISSRPRVWLDAGTQESPRELPDVQRLRDALVAKGWDPGRDLRYEEIQGGQHNEASWAARVGPFLQFLFPAGEAGV